MKNVLANWTIFEQMLLDDAIQQRFIHVVIPDAVGIHDQERAVIADAQARSNASFDTQRIVVAAEVAQFLCQAAIELLRLSSWITILAHTKKDMPGIGRLAWGIQLIWCPTRFIHLHSWRRRATTPLSLLECTAAISGQQKTRQWRAGPRMCLMPSLPFSTKVAHSMVRTAKVPVEPIYRQGG